MAHAATAAHIAVDLDAASTAATGDQTGAGRCHEVEDVLHRITFVTRYDCVWEEGMSVGVKHIPQNTP